MTLLQSAPPGLQGSQLPRLWQVPQWATTTGPEAIELCALAGLCLDPWQGWTLTQSLGERPDGKWAALQVGIEVSRQNGKGGLLEARELTGLFLLGERLIIHSAHQFDTSLEAFGRLLGLIEDHREFSRLIARVSNSHGQEGITLKSGQRIRFRTRTKGGGRGFTGDCLILDEAMDIPESAHAALFPTLSARPNPQVWYTGSAVDQQVDDNGIVFARVRESGLAAKPGVAWFEWSADLDINRLDPAKVADPLYWAQANPAMGIRISSDYISKELGALGYRKFAVERLGVGDWPRTDDDALRVIDLGKWNALEDKASSMDSPISLAFDVSPDRSSSSIGVAGGRKDGLAHLEVIEHRPGTGWLAARVGQIARRHRPFAVICDASGPAGSLIADVEHELGNTVLKVGSKDRGVTTVTAKQHGQAFGMVLDGVENATLRHRGGSKLRAALDGAGKRPLGDAFAWDRKTSSVDISPLVAVTLALWGEMQRRNKPKARVISLSQFANPGGR